MSANIELVAAVRSELAAQADPERALRIQAYMRTEMPCLGVTVPLQRDLVAWSRDRSLWKRRSSIICQMTLKEKTDLELLYACIEPNLGDRDFFIRKAIGWALRGLAHTNPDEVVHYVGANESRLSPLSKREALKNIPDD